MKRAALVILGVLGAGAALFGLVKAIPFVRYAIEVDQHTRSAALREPAAEQEWRREFGDTAQTLSVVPKRQDDSVAVRLIQLARSVGIDMARPRKGQATPHEPVEERALRQSVGNYATEELVSSGRRIGAPPEVVRVYLEAHRRDLDTIVDFLSTNEPPVWKSDVSLGLEAPVPNLLGHVRLQRLLVARALSQTNLDQANEAERSLYASWILNASLSGRLDLISQLVAISVARMQVGLARRVPIDPGSWRMRFADHDYRGSLLMALKVESAGVFRPLAPGASRWDRAARADYLDMRRAFLVGVRDMPIAEKPVAGPTLLKDEQPKSAGAILASIALPNLANAVSRVDRLILDTELTDRILQARMERARVGRWPTESPSLTASRMPGAYWIYSVNSAGQMTVCLSREPRWDREGQSSGLVLPLRYESY